MAAAPLIVEPTITAIEANKMGLLEAKLVAKLHSYNTEAMPLSDLLKPAHQRVLDNCLLGNRIGPVQLRQFEILVWLAGLNRSFQNPQGTKYRLRYDELPPRRQVNSRTTVYRLFRLGIMPYKVYEALVCVDRSNERLTAAQIAQRFSTKRLVETWSVGKKSVRDFCLALSICGVVAIEG